MDYRTPGVETEISVLEGSFARRTGIRRTPYGRGATPERDTGLGSDLTYMHLQGLSMGSPPGHLHSLQMGPLMP